MFTFYLGVSNSVARCLYQFTSRQSIGVALSIVFFLPASAFAHDGTPHTSTQSQRDTRDTPRSADQHETGKMPRSQKKASDAESKVQFEKRDGYRFVVANGLPNHATGQYPNRGNPNVISEQSYSFRLPLEPAAPDEPIQSLRDAHHDRGYLFGVALNGVPFEPATGMNWTAQGIRRGGKPGSWVYEAIGGSIDFGIDHANAHIQRTGAYHYHGVPVPFIDDEKPTLVGYAADGYPIYGPMGYKDPKDPKSKLIELQSSWQIKTKTRPESPLGPGGKPDGRFTADWEFVPGSGDLDALNGRFALTPEYPDGVYHYVLTTAFPHIPRGFAGKPDKSFHRTPGQGPNHVSQRGERLPLGDRDDLHIACG
ncbi:MAG: YHYH protein, partial [Phycisphaeraceae bacterium]